MNSLFISVNTYEKYIVIKDYCFSHNNDKTWFFSRCIYHILLIGDNEEMLQKLDFFASHINSLKKIYTLFKYRFGVKFVAESGQLFNFVQRAT